MNFEKPTIEEPKLEKEISQEQEKSSIERLEEIPFRIDKKIEILLCLKEEKLATDISIETQCWKEDESLQHLNLQEIKQIEDLIKDMDFNYIMGPKQVVDSEFFYKTKDGSEKPEKKEEIILYLAKAKENLDKLTEAIETQDDKLFGMLYGYPESAIKTYLEKGETIKASDLPLEIKNSDSLAFARFNLSKTHWPEELKTGEKWAKAVKKASPKLYNEYIEL